MSDHLCIIGDKMRVLKPGNVTYEWSAKIECDHCDALLLVEFEDVYSRIYSIGGYGGEDIDASTLSFYCVECGRSNDVIGDDSAGYRVVEEARYLRERR